MILMKNDHRYKPSILTHSWRIWKNENKLIAHLQSSTHKCEATVWLYATRSF